MPGQSVAPAVSAAAITCSCQQTGFTEASSEKMRRSALRVQAQAPSHELLQWRGARRRGLAMMERDQRAEPRSASPWQRTSSAPPVRNPCECRSFLDGSDEIWIEARLARPSGTRGIARTVLAPAKACRRRPGRFVHHFLAVEHRNAQISPRQLKSNRAANDPATHDDNVVRFHDIS